jgi:hypothetical protein
VLRKQPVPQITRKRSDLRTGAPLWSRKKRGQRRVRLLAKGSTIDIVQRTIHYLLAEDLVTGNGSHNLPLRALLCVLHSFGIHRIQDREKDASRLEAAEFRAAHLLEDAEEARRELAQALPDKNPNGDDEFRNRTRSIAVAHSDLAALLLRMGRAEAAASCAESGRRMFSSTIPVPQRPRGRVRDPLAMVTQAELRKVEAAALVFAGRLDAADEQLAAATSRASTRSVSDALVFALLQTARGQDRNLGIDEEFSALAELTRQEYRGIDEAIRRFDGVRVAAMNRN